MNQARNFLAGVDDPTAHQLRLLLTLAEELHFGRAASRLHLTQPALSQQIRSLEERLGVELFHRTSRRVELTAAGQAVLPAARNVVDAAEYLRNIVRGMASGPERLRLGVCESFAALPPTRGVIATLTDLDPVAGPEVRVLDRLSDQLSALQSGEIDAAFTHLPVPEYLDSEPLSTEPRMVCIASDDPLADRSSVRLADLADHRVISLVPPTFRAGHDFWAANPRPDGTPVRFAAHQGSSFQSVLSTISLGGVIAFVPAVAASFYPRPDLRYLHVEDLTECAFGVAWNPDNPIQSKITALRAAVSSYRARNSDEDRSKTPLRLGVA
ncbi:LysR family transcriptional regulator [Nocardia pseudobrasiliensis]|uniref:DNA-binding transcriptional LysR family regulator n=1 Tax=Nocardia pseudobrasiliensis TaxID=45979 RepID=A0A370IBY0_9NOCA|nr:LysR family transcriptional regulator [Nocardia pseudobrasiliensis]RDI68239.1 DNA-binding transcriptional LysR family regulator [Nocardia pseudobrasiliensis]